MSHRNIAVNINIELIYFYNFSYEFGNLALCLLDAAWVKDVVPHVYILFYGLISIFYSSVHMTLEPLLQARKTSLEVGSVEGILLSMSYYCQNAFLSGYPLTKLLSVIEEHKAASQSTDSVVFLCVNQAILNLVDTETTDPAILNGNLFNCTYCGDENNKESAIAQVSVICFLIAYLFHDYSLAMKLAAKCKELEKFLLCTFSHPIYIFYDGLVSLALARHHDKEQGIANASKIISQLKSMSQNAPMNFMNKVQLLEAELASICGDPSALERYKEAISSSQKNGFIHEEAICCERTGMFLLELDITDTQNAYQFLLQAYKCYERWGAATKCAQLRTKYPSLLEETNTPMSQDFEGLVLDNEQATVSLMTDITMAKPGDKKRR